MDCAMLTLQHLPVPVPRPTGSVQLSVSWSHLKRGRCWRLSLDVRIDTEYEDFDLLLLPFLKICFKLPLRAAAGLKIILTE